MTDLERMALTYLEEVTARTIAADKEAAASRMAFQLGPEEFKKYLDKKYAAKVDEWEKENVPDQPVDVSEGGTEPVPENSPTD